MKNRLPDERICELIKTVYNSCVDEDMTVRAAQFRQWRRLKLQWEGFNRIWFDSVAHDWRIWDKLHDSNSDQSYYDKQVNVFKAYLESIIAALSVTVPPIKCYPRDADDTLDLATAKAGDKLAQLVYRNNDIPLLWLHALFIYVTEGLVAFYSYTEEDEKYGTYKVQETKDVEESYQITKCPNCGYEIDSVPTDNIMRTPSLPKRINEGIENELGGEEALDSCPACGLLMSPEVTQESIFVEKIVKEFTKPKSKVCTEVYGGLYIKIPNYAKNQKTCPYLIKTEEVDISHAREVYPALYDKDQKDFKGDAGFDEEDTGVWARLSPQYGNDTPENLVSENIAWIRPSRYNVIRDEKDRDKLRELYPKGIKVTYVNNILVAVESRELDLDWTLLENPLSDYLHFQPHGESATSIQDITNDLISLVLQTIEHGIGQTFVDPAVLDFTAYQQSEVTPGGIFPVKATGRGGRGLSEFFHEMKTATLSGEVLPFFQQVQGLGQLTTGALPSLFGGALEGSETASQYSMSRAQALQRQQNTWKMFIIWWKRSFTQVIPKYIGIIHEDERDVQLDKDGNFVNILIRKSELEGNIGKVELEANENLPVTWGQVKDTVERLLMHGNPEVVKIIAAPENIPIIHEALGLSQFYIPGEDDVIAEYDEIKILLNSEPSPNILDDMGTIDEEMPEIPSVEIDALYDNHRIRFEIVRKWIISEAGRQAKIDNERGYKNVLLHGMLHKLEMDRAMMEQTIPPMPTGANGAAPPSKPTQLAQEALIQSEGDVSTIQ